MQPNSFQVGRLEALLRLADLVVLGQDISSSWIAARTVPPSSSARMSVPSWCFMAARHSSLPARETSGRAAAPVSATN
eukprot:11202100-Lingulodinium_polyedra.AAC.1